MPFDAAAARALARKSSDLLDVLSEAKRAIVAAAEAGEFFTTAALPEAVEVRTGAPVDAPDFLVSTYREAGKPILVDTVLELLRAGYVVRPGWGRAEAHPGGRAIVGLVLDWSIDDGAPASAARAARNDAPALRIVAASDAHAMTVQARAPRLWVERAMTLVRKAAEGSKFSCQVADDEPADSPAWARRRALLEASGFRLVVAARDSGALATIAW
jgi:hypothetical protein